MKNKLSGLSIALTAAFLGACASKPTEPVQQTPVVAPVVEPPVRNYEPAMLPPEAPVKIPTWYVSPPVMTTQSIFTAGTATSTSLSMATQKAIMDADTKLAFQMESSIKAMLKAYNVDSATGSIEHTELVAKKMAAIVINGHAQSDMQVTQDGRKFRVFVLMRYPLAGVNYFGDKVRAVAAAARARADSAVAHLESGVQTPKIIDELVESPAPTNNPVTTLGSPGGSMVELDAVESAPQSAVTPVVAGTPEAAQAQKLRAEVDAALGTR